MTDEEAKELITSCKLHDRADRATETALKSVDKKEVRFHLVRFSQTRCPVIMITTYSHQLDMLYQDTVGKVLGQPSADKYLAIYQRYADQFPVR